VTKQVRTQAIQGRHGSSVQERANAKRECKLVYETTVGCLTASR
jgi:hypothetical protein